MDSAGAALPSRLDAPPRRLRYFGDLDVAGLTIAARASQRAVEIGLPEVHPDLELYRLLLEYGRPQPVERARRGAGGGDDAGLALQLCACAGP